MPQYLYLLTLFCMQKAWLDFKADLSRTPAQKRAMVSEAAAETYDYVVVGAGSAGCVLAHRLTEAGASVLVVEAADPHPAWHRQDLPRAAARLGLFHAAGRRA